MDISGKLKRISAGTYKDERGDVWRLVPVDRNYQCKNKPIYYLQKIENNRAQYISGVFRTKAVNIFSADMKDELGVKKYYEIKSFDSGAELMISPSKGKIR